MRPGTRRLVSALTALLVGMVLAWASPVRAEPLPDLDPTVTATVWAHAPTTAEYRPSWGYTATNTDGGVLVRRTGTGAYTVVLEQAPARGGVAHVVAYGGGPVFCTVAGWYRSLVAPDLLIQVRCFAATGAPVDSRFVATFTNVRQISRGRLSWFVTDQAVPTGLRALAAPDRYDSTGGAVAYERLATGHYRFHMNRQWDYSFPMAHVTAVGSAAVHCQIDSPDAWDVWCRNAAGNPVDARFAVTYGNKVDLLGYATGPRFHTGVLYGEEASGGWVGGEDWNSTLDNFGGGVGYHLGAGRYQLKITGTGTAYGTAFVDDFITEHRPRPNGYCVVADWSRSGTDTIVNVRCYAYGGVPANINARVSYTSWPAA
ncbi:hypothetical protein [Micromonospora sp. KC723]|uniref:hypothetical protein n=1 Tax=Micromonospora sp. KC723 TaxID=2530381 RepID=UPI0010444FA1|nr:hypothetical protein [Micromonospora sp. KC723]TDB72394.1 hypothetical protein E1165_20330 [Micromonospora sp. KC723]